VLAHTYMPQALPLPFPPQAIVCVCVCVFFLRADLVWALYNLMSCGRLGAALAPVNCVIPVNLGTQHVAFMSYENSVNRRNHQFRAFSPRPALHLTPDTAIPHPTQF
jgi:hypothetical protein